MFFVYFLKSKKDNKLYIGCTNDLKKRLKEHNSGFVRATKSRMPLFLIYYETYIAKQDAYKREHNLKLRAKALRQLLKKIKISLRA